MKHIKKKFLHTISPKGMETLKSSYKAIEIAGSDGLKEYKGSEGFGVIALEDGSHHSCIVHNVNGNLLMIPMPNPTLVYFHGAQINLKEIGDCKKSLVDKLQFSTQEINETGLNEIYNYFSTASIFIISLFTAVESFINQMIPVDFIYERKMTKKTELFNKKQIQENIDFKTKLFEILDLATGESYFKKSTSTKQVLINLKEFRDIIVHTKPEGSKIQYDDLIKKSLNFDYVKSLETVAGFMNHYKPNFVEVCNCGNDF